LIFPLTLHMKPQEYVELLFPSFAIAAACVACRRFSKGLGMEWSAALVFTGGAAGLAVMELVRRSLGGVGTQSFSALPVALDLFYAGMIVVLVLQMDALNYVSYYFIATALTVIEGIVFIHSTLTLRLCTGIVLMAAAGFLLLRKPGTDAGTSVLRLR